MFSLYCDPNRQHTNQKGQPQKGLAINSSIPFKKRFNYPEISLIHLRHLRLINSLGPVKYHQVLINNRHHSHLHKKQLRQ